MDFEYESFHYNGMLLAGAIYSDDEEKFRRELSPQLQDIANYLVELFSGFIQKNSEPPDAAQSYRSFVSCITRYKDRGFKEEQELRVVALPSVLNSEYREGAGHEYCDSKPEKERMFRDKNGMPTPYIELFRSSNSPLPIEKIIVGPHKDKEARAAALRVMLRNTDIDVTVSDIPFIG